jgi:hypothetical protein
MIALLTRERGVDQALLSAGTDAAKGAGRNGSMLISALGHE